MRRRLTRTLLPIVGLAFACGGEEATGPTSKLEPTQTPPAKVVIVSTTVDQAGDVRVLDLPGDRASRAAAYHLLRRHQSRTSNTPSCASNCTSVVCLDQRGPWTRSCDVGHQQLAQDRP